METIFTNKRFINVCTIFIVLLSLLVFMRLVNEIKTGGYDDTNSKQPNIITVTGSGEVMATSDIATISINLSKDGATAKEAQANLNDGTAKTLDYLKSKKIDDKDIKSEYGGLNPKYSYSNIACLVYPCPEPQSKIIGYTATQSITVKIRDVDSANDIKTGLANIGVTDMSGPTFSVDNEDTFKDQARSIAIDDAETKAKELARELHVDLGKITSFTENNNSPYPIMYEAKAMGAAPSDTAPAPTLPKGQNKITSSVTITYEIR